MAVDTAPAERTLAIPAEHARLRDVRRFAEETAAECGFAAAEVEQIKLAINEAAANAVEHGSASPGDEVRLRASAEDGALAIYVADAGRFVPSASAWSELAERGRGMLVMALLMDEVDVRPSPDGTVIRLSRQLPGERPAPM